MNPTATTADPGPTPPAAPTRVPGAKVERLAAQAADAAAVRGLTTHPDVIALRVEKVRAQVDALLWAGIVLGLAFTMVNVQTFAAAGAEPFAAGWWVAWLLDPMVSLVLLAVLRAEQVTARYQVELPTWAHRTKWLTFAATYVMNTWTSWGLSGAPLSWSGIVLHSVPPLVVFATAETGPGLRDRLTESVRRALADHTTATPEPAAPPIEHTPEPEPIHEPVHEPAPAPVHEPAPEPAPEPTPVKVVRRRTTKRKPAPRRLLADYLTDARTALDAALADGAQVEPTPAWCREVTGCSAGTSVKVAAALREPARPTAVPTPVTTEQEAA